MGQQQLLLLVLATVIVGLATVAGIQAFDQGQVQAEQDALTQEAVSIASDVQATAKKPSQFGGYDDDLSEAKGTITLSEMGYESGSDGIYEVPDGECSIVAGGGSTALSAGDGNTGVTTSGEISVLCESEDVEVVANISSLESGGIDTEAGVDTETDVSGTN